MCGWSGARDEAPCLWSDPVMAPAHTRRQWMSRNLAAALMASGILGEHVAHAAGDEFVFDAKSLDDALRAMGGIQSASNEIVLSVPEAVNNGAFVAVTLNSLLANTQEMSIIVEANPNPMAVRFSIPEGTEPTISTRVKLAETSRVYAIVKAGDRLYSTYKQIEVAVGGCA
jgi:sulfur-oxidizing protein SoxY